MDIHEIQAKSILVKSNIPGVDYVINPYIGCMFACKYCYASFMGRFVDKTIDQWGTYIYPKINAVEILDKELKKLRGKGEGLEIFISSVTDPYQDLEAKYALTRGCLDRLATYGFLGSVSILTKSHLVTRDIHIFKRILHLYVGLTITSTEDEISRYFETYAPPVSKRLSALHELNKNGITTYAFIGPLLPHYVATPRNLEKIFQALVDTGTRNIFVEHMNLSRYIRDRLMKAMRIKDVEVVRRFYSSQSLSYRKELDTLVFELVRKYKMNMMTNSTIFHKEYQLKRQRSSIQAMVK